MAKTTKITETAADVAPAPDMAAPDAETTAPDVAALDAEITAPDASAPPSAATTDAEDAAPPAPGVVVILSSAPRGFRRGGQAHEPGVTRWPAGTFDARQIAQIEADPLFQVVAD